MAKLWIPGSPLNFYMQLKQNVESWIERTISGDAKLKRRDSNFGIDPKEQIKHEGYRLNKSGIRIYSGSGNFFLVDMNHPQPVVLHRRPLAQRQVVLDFQITMGRC